jgi:hypothetical protein
MNDFQITLKQEHYYNLFKDSKYPPLGILFIQKDDKRNEVNLLNDWISNLPINSKVKLTIQFKDITKEETIESLEFSLIKGFKSLVENPDLEELQLLDQYSNVNLLLADFEQYNEQERLELDKNFDRIENVLKTSPKESEYILLFSLQNTKE